MITKLSFDQFLLILLQISITFCQIVVSSDQNEQSCSRTIISKETWISTPNYPQNYDNSITCKYTIERYSRDTCKIELLFEHFDLEDTLPLCDADFLDLSDGRRICGTMLPNTKFTIKFPPNEKSIKLVFQSSPRRNRKGFTATLRQLSESCDSDVSYRRPKSFPDAFDAPASSFDENEIPMNKYYNNCNVLLSGFDGNIRSPGFPVNYPPNRYCTYIIRKADQSVCRIDLLLKQFDIEYNLYSGSSECESDYLELPDRSRICGFRNERRTLYFPSKSDFIILTFRSDNKGSSTGFDIDIKQIPNSCGHIQPSKLFVYFPYPVILTPIQTLPTQADYKCDYLIDTQETRIRSPGYPSFYRPNEQCVYFLKKINNNICSYEFDFVRFNLESARDDNGICSKDFLQISDGTRLCGNITEKRIFPFEIGTGHLPMIYFTSDDFNEGLGYDIIVRQLPCGKTGRSLFPTAQSQVSSSPNGQGVIPCDRVITGNETISSPNYPRDYPALTKCTYTIYKSHSDVCEVNLQFTNFDIEATSECRGDYILIESTSEKFCGRDLINPSKVIRFPIGSKQMRLIFSSDTQVQRTGFEAKVIQSRYSCRKPVLDETDNYEKPTCEVTSSKSTIFRSVNYPMPYNSNIDCKYRVYRASKDICALDIYFSDFWVGTSESKQCLNDYLEIDGLRYCGLRSGERLFLSFPSYIEYLDIKFKTNAFENYGGFRIEVKQITERCHQRSSNGGSNLFANDNIGSSVALIGNNFHNNNHHNHACDEIYSNEMFTITSPHYGRRNYEHYTDCHFTVKKNSYNVCALEITYKHFDIEESSDCNKDYLEISTVKHCGLLPYDAKRTYEFPDEELIIKFHTDGGVTGPGFLANIKQIQC